jgi:hypothetical protein
MDNAMNVNVPSRSLKKYRIGDGSPMVGLETMIYSLIA